MQQSLVLLSLLFLWLQASCSNRLWSANAFTTTTTTTTTTTLFQRLSALGHGRRNVDEEEQATAASALRNQIRFLGRGPNAVVRPGCVLVAPSHEFHHYYRRAAILVHTMGEADDGSGDYVIRGLILDHPTPFTLSEMMDHQPAIVQNPLGNNLLFRGGDKGGNGVILLHAQADFERPEIGTSGLYEGGWQAALAMCNNNNAASDDDSVTTTTTTTDSFKAFFNYCEFTEQELEDLLDSTEDGDAWVSLEVPADFCLNGDHDRGDAWATLRNVVQQLQV